MKVPVRYIPNQLTKRDQKSQAAMLAKSRKLYKRGQYYTRKQVPSFHSKPSKHVKTARKIYGVDHIAPDSRLLAKATGCSSEAMRKIVSKGEGAYFSSGSRPNQTAQSWGIARLASALTAGKSAAVDYTILEKGCRHSGKAFRLAKSAVRKYGYGHSHTQRRTV